MLVIQHLDFSNSVSQDSQYQQASTSVLHSAVAVSDSSLYRSLERKLSVSAADSAYRFIEQDVIKGSSFLQR